MRVFLSYASEDRELVEAIYLSLRAQGHTVFFDRRDLPPGEEYDARIRRGIERSQLLVFLISPYSLDAGNYTLTELGIAHRIALARRPPFIRFAHCYCSRCRKATGGVRATNIAVVPDQFRWVSGEELISRYDLPEARSFARQICKRCNCPVPHKSRNGEHVIVSAGTLDDDPGSKPTAHRNWGSRVSWATVDKTHLPISE